MNNVNKELQVLGLAYSLFRFSFVLDKVDTGQPWVAPWVKVIQSIQTWAKVFMHPEAITRILELLLICFFHFTLSLNHPSRITLISFLQLIQKYKTNKPTKNATHTHTKNLLMGKNYRITILLLNTLNMTIALITFLIVLYKLDYSSYNFTQYYLKISTDVDRSI